MQLRRCERSDSSAEVRRVKAEAIHSDLATRQPLTAQGGYDPIASPNPSAPPLLFSRDWVAVRSWR
jgi:hypothetical protein